MHLQSNKIAIYFALLFTNLFFNHAFAQISCPTYIAVNCNDATSQFIQNPTPNNLDFVFDNLSKYVSGITYSGSTILKLKIDSNNAYCKWKLVMYVNNTSSTGDEWETIQNYGAGGKKPTVDLIQVRVYNYCGTPQGLGKYQTFPLGTHLLRIIDDPIHLNPSGLCNLTEVNSFGNYLTNYGEYSFIIDYRIIPAFSLNLSPGSYQVQIKFCLELN